MTEPRNDMGNRPSNLFERLRAALIERYDLRELVGRGGMGAVYLAVDRKLEREVAVKVLPPEFSHDEKVIERFEREARTAAKLDHANVIPIYSVESHGEFHYIVMKYVCGKSLEQILEAGPMPVELAQRIVWEAALALGHAHQRGIVHRDIKPANIMIDEHGRTMLTDFGISKAVESAASSLTATGQVVGTPHYMSPEQGKGLEVDGRSDQYSLAVVAYRLLTGSLPYNEDSVHAVLYKKIFEDPTPIEELRPDIPDHMAVAFRRAMSRDPEDRFPTMEEFASAIWPEQSVSAPRWSRAASFSRGSLEGDTQIAPIELKPKTKKRRVGLVLTSLFVVAAGGGVGGWYWVNFRPEAEGGSNSQALGFLGGEDSLSVGTPLDTAGAAVNESIAVDSDTASRPEEPQPPRQQPQTTRRNDPPRTQPRPQRPPAQPAEPEVGTFFVNAAPVYGTVYIDGVRIDDTPLRRDLSPGPHVVEIRRPGYETIVDTVLITANNDFRRSYTLVSIPE